MKISREIIINGMSNNTEYELTGIEAELTFNEVQAKHDANFVYDALRDQEYEDMDSIPDDLIAAIVKKFREKIDSTMVDVMLNVLEDYGDELKKYKEKLRVYEYEITLTRTKRVTVAARSEENANALLDKMIENGDMESEFTCEESEFDYGYPDEIDGDDPEWADFNAEEDM